MSITLPPLLAAFNKAQNDHDSEAYAGCFANDAVIRDEPEGTSVRGAAAIKSWNEETTSKYNLVVEPVALVELTDETVLTSRVSGDFDGSPILFDYHLTLADQKIAALSIRLSPR